MKSQMKEKDTAFLSPLQENTTLCLPILLRNQGPRLGKLGHQVPSDKRYCAYYKRIRVTALLDYGHVFTTKWL